MDELTKNGFRVACSFKEEGSEVLALLEVEGISESFSAIGNVKTAAKNAAANLAQKHIKTNNISAAQLYSDELSAEFSGGVTLKESEDEAPNQMLRRLYPDVEINFECVCVVQVGENQFEARDPTRGVARVKAAAAALESLHGVTFEIEKYIDVVKKETKDSKNTEKHPASALHEVVGQNAVFNFEEKLLPDGERILFTCSVKIDDKLFYGKASSKRLAKYNAALTALNGLGLTKKFKLMPPPIDSTVGAFNPAKRRMEQSMGVRGFPFKRGRGAPVTSPRFSDRLGSKSAYPTTPTRERGRGRTRAPGRGWGGFGSRGGPGSRGRGQAVGDFSTAAYPPQDRPGMQEPGYGPSRDPYPDYGSFSPERGGYNQRYSSGYNSYPQPSSPASLPARGNAYSPMRGIPSFGAYPNTNLEYYPQYDY